jgi:hypothetical protein
LQLCSQQLNGGIIQGAPNLISVKQKYAIYKNTMEYYSAIKKDEIILYARKWMEVEIMLSKIKPNYHMLLLI